MEKVNLADAFARIDRPWAPRLAAELNGQHVRLARLEGAFTWHAHEHEDELFLCVSGRVRLELEGRDPVVLEPGELCVVPRGTRHRPVAEPQAEVLLFEPASTINTGDADDPRTVRDVERL